ncbi:MAG TPA: alpha/beta fold hydrolase [Gemmatimonadaceae bacterium]|nr:alpha/beta fold hydrolase [Gemmatimonadaceae bacterium]
MTAPHATRERTGYAGASDARERLLAGLPVVERRLELAGLPTALLEGGDGPPVVLLHGPAGNATHWMRVIPALVGTHRIVAPDLPGHGSSELADGPPDAARVLAWLGELIAHTCPSPPALVGYALGGAIAARFAATRGDELDRLVLVDTLGLVPFQPAPEFGRALEGFLAQPSARTHDELWRYCAHDLDALQRRMGDERWDAFAAYNLDRIAAPGVHAALGALMGAFGGPPIPADELARITVPTTLIWGRHDLATPLTVAEGTSARYGWPLRVIDGSADDPALEQPEAFAAALREALR